MPPPIIAIRFMLAADLALGTRCGAENSAPIFIIKLFLVFTLSLTAANENDEELTPRDDATHPFRASGFAVRGSSGVRDLHLNHIVSLAARSRCWPSVRIRLIAAWDVNAAGLFSQHISGHRVGARAAASADIAKLAGPALAMQQVGVAQLYKDRRLLVDVRQRIAVQVAAFDGQEPAGEDLANMGDEHKSAPIVNAFGGPAHGFVFAAAARMRRPSVMRCGSGAGVIMHANRGPAFLHPLLDQVAAV